MSEGHFTRDGFGARRASFDYALNVPACRARSAREARNTKGKPPSLSKKRHIFRLQGKKFLINLPLKCHRRTTTPTTVMTEFKFFCPLCGKQIQCDTSYGGSQINCPACQQPITVPTASNPTSTPTMQAGTAPAGKPVDWAKRKIMAGAAAIVILFALIALAAWFFVFNALPRGVPRDGLVAYWRADGNAKSLFGKLDGKLAGGATFAGGLNGRAFLFNGHGATVKIPGGSDFDFGDKVTIEFWMKAATGNSMRSYQGLVTSDFWWVSLTSGYTPNIGVNFGISTDGGRSFAETANPNGGGCVVSAGEWHHVAGVYDGAELQLYVDGTPAGRPLSHAGAISKIPSRSFVAIGSEDGRSTAPDCVGTRYFNDLIDEIGIYRRALSPDEIAAIYDFGKPRN